MRRCESAPQLQEILTKPSIPQLEEIITEDGILCSILLFLPLREAVRSSLLSRRWRHIWTHLPVLNFDPVSIFDDRTLRAIEFTSPLPEEEKARLRETQTDQFIRSVNSVLQQHQGRVDVFLVWYFLHNIHSHHLDAWVRFAVRSKSRNIYFILSQKFWNVYAKLYNLPFQLWNVHSKVYDFPFHLLRSSSATETLWLVCCSLKPPFKFDSLSHLKELTLYDIDVTDENMNHLIYNCSNLETLCIGWARGLGSLVFSRPMSNLRLLAVKGCTQLWKMEMDAINLTTLEYKGVPIDFGFRQSSRLKEADICFEADENEHSLGFCLAKLSNNLPHLQSLKFSIYKVLHEAIDFPKVTNIFSNLTHLVWEWNVRVKMDNIHLSTILDAAPMLEKLNLRLLYRVVEEIPQILSKSKEIEEIPQILSKSKEIQHKHLKTIEIRYFYFDKWQFEIALYLLNIAIKLESMTIVKGSKTSSEIDEMSLKILSEGVSTNVELVLL